MLRSRSVTVKIGFVARRGTVSCSLVRRSFPGAAPFRAAAGLARLRADAFRDVARVALLRFRTAIASPFPRFYEQLQSPGLRKWMFHCETRATRIGKEPP